MSVLLFRGRVELHGKTRTLVRIRVYDEYAEGLSELKGQSVVGLIVVGDPDEIKCPILRALVKQALAKGKPTVVSSSNS